MKRQGKHLVMFSCMIAALVGGCTVRTKDEGTERAQIEKVEEQKKTQEQERVESNGIGFTGVINPIQTVTAEELCIATGVELELSEAAENANYMVINTADENKLGQIDFSYGGKKVSLRVRKTMENDPEDISGLYYTWKTVEQRKVQEEAATAFLCDGVGYISWLKDGVLYNLSMTKDADADTLENIANTVVK